MNYDNPYNNFNLKYPLSNDDIKYIDDVWILIDKLRKTFLTRGKYKKYVTKIINKYNIDNYLILEKIIEKMYWNLVYKFNSKFYTISKTKIYNIKYNKNNENEQINLIKNDILIKNIKITESMIDKTYIIANNNIFYKYTYPDDFDLFISSIIINRSIYETIMSNNDYNDLHIEPYNNIVEFDFPFPNLNTIKEFIYNNEIRKNNIIKLYHSFLQ